MASTPRSNSGKEEEEVKDDENITMNISKAKSESEFQKPLIEIISASHTMDMNMKTEKTNVEVDLDNLNNFVGDGNLLTDNQEEVGLPVMESRSINTEPVSSRSSSVKGEEEVKDDENITMNISKTKSESEFQNPLIEIISASHTMDMNMKTEKTNVEVDLNNLNNFGGDDNLLTDNQEEVPVMESKSINTEPVSLRSSSGKEEEEGTDDENITMNISTDKAKSESEFQNPLIEIISANHIMDMSIKTEKINVEVGLDNLNNFGGDDNLLTDNQKEVGLPVVKSKSINIEPVSFRSSSGKEKEEVTDGENITMNISTGTDKAKSESEFQNPLIEIISANHIMDMNIKTEKTNVEVGLDNLNNFGGDDNLLTDNQKEVGLLVVKSKSINIEPVSFKSSSGKEKEEVTDGENITMNISKAKSENEFQKPLIEIISDSHATDMNMKKTEKTNVEVDLDNLNNFCGDDNLLTDNQKEVLVVKSKSINIEPVSFKSSSGKEKEEVTDGENITMNISKAKSENEFQKPLIEIISDSHATDMNMKKTEKTNVEVDLDNLNNFCGDDNLLTDNQKEAGLQVMESRSINIEPVSFRSSSGKEEEKVKVYENITMNISKAKSESEFQKPLLVIEIISNSHTIDMNMKKTEKTNVEVDLDNLNNFGDDGNLLTDNQKKVSVMESKSINIESVSFLDKMLLSQQTFKADCGQQKFKNNNNEAQSDLCERLPSDERDNENKDNTASYFNVDTDTKFKLLEQLIQMCKENQELYEVIGHSSLIYYTQNLLLSYCDAVNVNNNRREDVNVRSKSTSELVLLIPILKLLIPSANTAVHTVREIFLYRSRVLLRLMRASTECSYNFVSTFKKVCAAISDRTIVGAFLKMSPSDTNILYEKCFGISISSLNLKLTGFHVTFYDTTGADNININLDIIQNQPPCGKKFTCTEFNPVFDLVRDCCENVENAEWSDVVVARVLLLKVALVYKTHDWRDSLNSISGRVQEHLKNTELYEPQVGDICGFLSWDATFDGLPLGMMTCFRGQILTLNGDWAMLWALDVGLLIFILKSKLCSLPEDLTSQAPLIHICLLQGPVCELDEEFLKSAHKLLHGILETNTQFGKHMLLCNSGDHILHLLEYPESEVRITFLELLLCLTKNKKDIVKFLTNHHFNGDLIGKLERFSHIHAAGLYTCKELIDKEIKLMISVLLAILEQMEDVKHWRYNKRVTRILHMLLSDEQCEWKELVEVCLSVLDRASNSAPESHRGGFRNGYQHGWKWDYNNESGGHHSREMSESSNDSEIGSRGGNVYRGRDGRDSYEHSGRDGYGRNSRGGYNNFRGGYSNFRGGYNNFRGGYNNFRGGYNNFRGGYNNFRGGWKSHNYRGSNEHDNYRGSNEHDNYRCSNEHDNTGGGRYGNNDRNNNREHNEDRGRYNTGERKHVADDKTQSEVEEQKDGNGEKTEMGNKDNFEDSHDTRCGHQMQLSRFNILEPPTSVYGRRAVTYDDIEDKIDDLPPVPEANTKSPEKVLHTAELNSEVDYMVYGTKADIKCDDTHELITETDLSMIKEVSLAQIFCGLLNNNLEGSVYFGLSEDSTIKGLKLGHEDRDIFRSGIDQIMNQCLVPEVRANCYDIIFTRVLHPKEKVTDLSQHSIYIVEVKLRPMLHMVYTVFHGHNCFVRRGTQTVETTVNQWIQEELDAEERAMKKTLDEMETASRSSLSSLAEFVENHLPQPTTHET